MGGGKEGGRETKEDGPIHQEPLFGMRSEGITARALDGGPGPMQLSSQC